MSFEITLCNETMLFIIRCILNCIMIIAISAFSYIVFNAFKIKGYGWGIDAIGGGACASALAIFFIMYNKLLVINIVSC